MTSNLTGDGIDIVRKFLGKLAKPQTAEKTDTQSLIHTNFTIDSRFNVKGVSGIVVNGVVLKGTITINQDMMLGPDRNGNFKAVTVKGIHENRVAIDMAPQYSLVCLNIKSKEPLKEASIRKGTCLINPLKVVKPGVNPYHSICVKYFEAKIKVLHHHTTI